MEERLRKFAQLVEAGSFTRAAVELHVSQPALSTSIAKLERELKTPLLIRGVRPLALTPAGKLAYQTAKDLSVQADNLKLRLAELARQPLTLRIGMIDSVADALFEDDTSLEMLQDAKVSIVVNNSRYLAEAVERGDLDIAFSAEQQGRLPALLEAKPVGTEPLAVVCRAGRHASSSASLPDFIAYDQPSNTFRLVNDYFRSQGVTPEVNFYSTSPEVMLRLVLLGKGVAALPYLMIREHLQSGELQRLALKNPWLIPRSIVVLKRRDRELPSALKQLTARTTHILRALWFDVQV